MGQSDFGGLLEPHPAISKLADPASRTRNTTGAIALTGFVGKSEDATRVRLHRSLTHLDHWIEVRRDDILHVALADQDLQRVTVWLPADAAIARSTLSPQAASTDLVTVDRGRLRMMISEGIAAAVGPVGPSGGCGCRR